MEDESEADRGVSLSLRGQVYSLEKVTCRADSSPSHKTSDCGKDLQLCALLYQESVNELPVSLHDFLQQGSISED